MPKAGVTSPKILFNAKDHPDLNSAYALMTRHLVPRLAEHYGRDNIFIHAPVYARERVEEWQGIKVLPGLNHEFEDALLLEHYQRLGCHMLVQVGDWFMLKLIPQWAAEDKILWVQWSPWDLLNPGDWVKNVLRFAIKVVPFTQYGEREMRALGMDVAPAIWPGLDLSIWRPRDRATLSMTMASLGFADDTFNIVILQANQLRKYLREQLEAIKLFQDAVPEAKPRLYLHSQMTRSGERDLQADLAQLGLNDISRTIDPYVMATGGLPEEDIVRIFACADVVMDCCFEGYGYSAVQAQAVGVPVVVLGMGPGPELTRYGIQVATHHIDRNAIVQKPVADPADIAQALVEVYQRGPHPTEEGRELASSWVQQNLGWDLVAQRWTRVIDEVMELRETYSLYIPEPGLALQARAAHLVELT